VTSAFQSRTVLFIRLLESFGQFSFCERDLAMNQLLLLLILAGVVTFYVYTLYGKRTASKYKLPPLVPGIPVMGNALQVPPTQQGPWAKELAEKYGEM